MKKIGVLISGGDAPGMNAAIRGVVRTAIYHKLEVVGVIRGYNGLINQDIIPMNVSSVSDIIQRGGTIIHTARSEEFMTEKGQDKAVAYLKEIGIDGLVVIGGDGSLKGSLELSKRGIKTIGVPGTIDNDVAFTDYTIGFNTAVDTALEAIGKIRDTSSAHERINIVEVMGRNCGDIALYAGLAGGADDILVPERAFHPDEICKRIKKGIDRGKKHSIIVLAEGAGKASDIEKKIEDCIHIETKTTTLGYIQRGGSPTAFDRLLASQMGSMAVDLLLQGKSSRVVANRNNKYIDMDLEEALSMKKEFNNHLYKLSQILEI